MRKRSHKKNMRKRSHKKNMRKRSHKKNMRKRSHIRNIKKFSRNPFLKKKIIKKIENIMDLAGRNFGNYELIGKPLGNSKNEVYLSCNGECIIKLQIIKREHLFLKEVELHRIASDNNFGPTLLDHFIQEEDSIKYGVIVTEKLDISLINHMCKNKIEELSNELLLDILNLLKKCFKNGINYKDLHLGNIMLNNGRLYLIDYDDADLLIDYEFEFINEIIFNSFLSLHTGPIDKDCNINIDEENLMFIAEENINIDYNKLKKYNNKKRIERKKMVDRIILEQTRINNERLDSKFK